MNKVRFGVVGLGNMGSGHAVQIAASKNRAISLAAVCDIVPEKAEAFGRQCKVPHFLDAQAMFDSGLIDAAIIAVPHYWHAPLTIRAARAGLHVLCEKPMASTIGPARAMVAECKKLRKALGCVLHHRSRSIMIKMNELVSRGVVGEVFRAQLVCSNWFRTQAYYDSGAWRGTWDGEGGGVLINQAPHHLDLFAWIAGMPKRVLGLLSTRAHKIEVEDTANFLLDYGKGKVGYIYATTAEEPGYEQFMVCGDKGTLVCEGGKLKLGKLAVPVSKHIMGSTQAGAGGAEQGIEWSEVTLPKDEGGRHIMMVEAFAKHILKGTPMYITGEEALNELELSNAMYLAGYEGRSVELPVQADQIDRLIRRLEKEHSTGKGQGIRKKATADLKRLLS
ncbi:MAG: Gfo/Idh/MocA family oxidoreductase [Planctomycetaceae bacterium]|nr:Gfo/Idh/MocA family oxidoreductase [Planctomycetaceae bacterium]